MGTKNIYGEVRINNEIVATQDWVAANASGGGAKEVVFCDVGKMWQDQDVPLFLELSQRFEAGEIIIVGYLDGQIAIVNGLDNQGNNNISWVVTSYGENVDSGIPMLIGALVKCVNGEYLDVSMNIKYLDFVNANYVNSLPENYTLTDDEQAKWCDWLAAAPRLNSNANGCDSLWIATNEQGTWRYIQVNAYTATPGYFTVYMPESIGDFTSGGYILTETPTRPYHAANKKYVDNLPDYLTLTDDEQEKWRGMIGAGVEQEITFSDELKSIGTISVINTHDPDYFMFQIASLVYSIQAGNTIYIGADKTPILVDRIQRIAGKTTIRTKQGVTLPEFTANVGDAVYIQEVSAIDGYLMKDTTAREEIAKIKQHLGIE